MIQKGGRKDDDFSDEKNNNKKGYGGRGKHDLI